MHIQKPDAGRKEICNLTFPNPKEILGYGDTFAFLAYWEIPFHQNWDICVVIGCSYHV